jgi:hypothetical protein
VGVSVALPNNCTRSRRYLTTALEILHRTDGAMRTKSSKSFSNYAGLGELYSTPRPCAVPVKMSSLSTADDLVVHLGSDSNDAASSADRSLERRVSLAIQTTVIDCGGHAPARVESELRSASAHAAAFTSHSVLQYPMTCSASH